MASEEPLKVTFFPPLYLQRKIWVLNVLRREDITSVVDIGCGEGELLACLAQPAPWLRPPPHSIRSKPAASETNGNLTKSVDPDQCEIANLHCTNIQGLDISASDLQYAVLGTAPPRSNYQHVRWEPLEAKIWHGGLESFNPEFVDAECIVSTEVIEHLPPAILPIYAPMLLGIYHPRRLLLTTPSYTFNARFTPPNVSERSGYPDPTGRTNRIFRHHDHKFEWTVEEFKEWCEAASEMWGYNVVVETIGRALEKDPWGRDAECGGASQVAEFTRKDGTGLAEMREAKSAAVKSRATQEKGHELLTTHQHTMHPSAQLPIASLMEISEAVKLKMEQLEEALMRFEELWFEKDIAILCGGWIELLMDAVEDDERLHLLSMDSPKREDWRVELVGGMQRKEDLWSDNAVPEDRRSPIDGSEPEEDFEDAVEDEDDAWSNTGQITEELDISQGWGTNGSSWGEPKPWILSGSDKEMVGEDKSWAEVWGSANGDWETISTSVNTGPGATREL